MELIQLTPGAYQLRAGSNAGLIVHDGRALLIDTGLDKDTARKILRHVESLKARLAAIIITHAHADHFGGAATLRSRTAAPVYAPGLEAAVIANPILEPLYLFSGALPPAELRHKFTLADACPVDHILEAGDHVLEGVAYRALPAPGHAPDQMMIAGAGACFVADALFAPDILAKHGIPFYVDIDRTLETLAALPALDGAYAAFVPGHGPATPSLAEWAGRNAARILEIRQAVAAALAETDDVGALLALTAGRLGVAIGNPVTYWLGQTTVLACLASLQSAGQATVSVVDNRLVWRAKLV
jgi:glyoxylase-like metal-dependent hydrolase (beta-lactamase superfamily II)